MLNRNAIETLAILEELEKRKGETRQAWLRRALNARHEAHPELLDVDLDGLAERLNAGRRHAFQGEEGRVA